MNTRELSAVVVFTSLAVAGRFALLIFPNISLIIPITIIAGLLMGYRVGMATGFLSFLLSDMYIGLNFWTFIDGAVASLVGGLSSLISIQDSLNRGFIFVYTVLLTLLYDVLTSILNMMMFGVPPFVAIINLFIPAIIGGVPYPMGPLHELTNGLLVSLIYDILSRQSWIKEVILNTR